MNKLNLDHLYVLTGSGTASASEMVINGLKPYIDVTLIGEQTVGKDVGSVTLYDSPPYYSNKENLNPDHKAAMQPIVVKLFNSEGNDYSHHSSIRSNGNVGFPADYAVREIDHLEDLPPLGDPDDPLLHEALQVITGSSVAQQKIAPPFNGKIFKDSRDLKPFGKDMRLNPGTVKKIKSN